MPLLQAKNLTISQVHQLLGFVRLPHGTFAPLLQFQPLTAFEQQELNQIQSDFERYLADGKVAEELVKALTTYPLLRLAGFYRHPIKLSIEQDISEIVVADADCYITGKLDILAFCSSTTSQAFFWLLVIESKNSAIAPSAGLPQLLIYAHQSLETQPATWGLVTNGELYQFVHIQTATQPTYQLMPILSLLEPEPSVQLLQVLKAIQQIAMQPNHPN